ncbi:phosphopantetheine-binding protein [Spirillospora sp. NPDC048911]|uniref:phosphopantetheine-binding protein n=1 Tax=Spirillospora sp. NPDC048911 TaxID=3364527 RepID=UPI00371B7D6B
MTISTDGLRETVAQIIGTDPGAIADDANLIVLGLGSLEMMRLVTRWRRQGIDADFTELAAEPTVAAWTAHLKAVAGA